MKEERKRTKRKEMKKNFFLDYFLTFLYIETQNERDTKRNSGRFLLVMFKKSSYSATERELKLCAIKIAYG